MQPGPSIAKGKSGQYLKVRPVSRQAGGVMQKVLNCYGILVCSLKARKIRSDGLPQIQVPGLNQLHHRQCRGQRFGQRCQVKHGLFGHGPVPEDAGPAIGPEKQHRIRF